MEKAAEEMPRQGSGGNLSYWSIGTSTTSGISTGIRGSSEYYFDIHTRHRCILTKRDPLFIRLNPNLGLSELIALASLIADLLRRREHPEMAHIRRWEYIYRPSTCG